MSITVAWDNIDKTVIRYEFDGRWTWEDVHAARTEEHALLATVPHTVDVILDFRKSTIVPQDPIWHLSGFDASSPANSGLTIIVGANAYLRALAQVFRSIYLRSSRHKFLFAEALDEAYAIIDAQRE